MTIDRIVNLSQTNAGWDLIKTLWSYYKIKDYLSFRYYETFEEDKVVTLNAYQKNSRISGEQVFWSRVFTGQYLPGTKIKLLNFQASPWFPRKPGTYWTHSAALARKNAIKEHVERVEDGFLVFDVWGKTLMSEVGGIGSVNIRKNRDDVLFTLTASGHTDRGIPAICSPDVWRDIDNALKENQCVEVDIRGTIEPLPPEYDSYFLRSAGLPKIAVRISSMMNVEIKQSDLSIFACPWTIFKTESQSSPYGFTYVTHNIGTDNYRNSVRWIEDYVEQHNGKLILTDFDEETSCLNARFPLSGCLDGSILNDEILEFCQGIARQFSRR